MIKYISVLLIFAHITLIVGQSFSYQPNEFMKVIKVIDDKFSANMGRKQGIKENTYYLIINRNKTIGRAVVIAVRENKSALKIVSLNPGEKIKPGYLLIQETRPIEKSETLPEDLERENFSKEKLVSSKDCYYEGYNRAQKEYTGGGATAGGFFAGFALGLIGWGIGYLILSGQEVDIPHHYVSELESRQRLDFSSGYQEYVKKKRRKSFNNGAVAGIVLAVGVALIVYSNQLNKSSEVY